MNPEKSFLNKAKDKAVELKEAAKNNAKKGITYTAFTLASLTGLAEGNKTTTPVKPENNISTENKIPEKNVDQNLNFAQEQERIQAEKKQKIETLKATIAKVEQQKKETTALLEQVQADLKKTEDQFMIVYKKALSQMNSQNQHAFEKVGNIPGVIRDNIQYYRKHNLGVDLNAKYETIVTDVYKTNENLFVTMINMTNPLDLGSVTGTNNASINSHTFLGGVQRQLTAGNLAFTIYTETIANQNKVISQSQEQIKALNQDQFAAK